MPFPPEPDENEIVEDVVDIDLSGDLSGGIQFDSITSGADPTAWDPIFIEQEDEEDENEEVLDAQLENDDQPPSITSGNDPGH